MLTTDLSLKIKMSLLFICQILTYFSACLNFETKMDLIDSEVTNVVNMSSCQSNCQSNSQCDFWQYDISTETCGIKTGAEAGNTSLVLGTVMGSKNCRPKHPSREFILKDLDIMLKKL